jgi:hypothetical protein
MTSRSEYCPVETKLCSTRNRRLVGILQVSNLPGSIYYVARGDTASVWTRDPLAF